MSNKIAGELVYKIVGDTGKFQGAIEDANRVVSQLVRSKVIVQLGNQLAHVDVAFDKTGAVGSRSLTQLSRATEQWARNNTRYLSQGVASNHAYAASVHTVGEAWGSAVAKGESYFTMLSKAATGKVAPALPNASNVSTGVLKNGSEEKSNLNKKDLHPVVQNLLSQSGKDVLPSWSLTHAKAGSNIGGLFGHPIVGGGIGLGVDLGIFLTKIAKASNDFSHIEGGLSKATSDVVSNVRKANANKEYLHNNTALPEGERNVSLGAMESAADEALWNIVMQTSAYDDIGLITDYLKRISLITNVTQSWQKWKKQSYRAFSMQKKLKLQWILSMRATIK